MIKEMCLKKLTRTWNTSQVPSLRIQYASDGQNSF